MPQVTPFLSVTQSSLESEPKIAFGTIPDIPPKSKGIAARSGRGREASFHAFAVERTKSRTLQAHTEYAASSSPKPIVNTF